MRDTILAAVVTRKHSDKVKGMNSILKAMSHDLENGVTILVQH